MLSTGKGTESSLAEDASMKAQDKASVQSSCEMHLRLFQGKAFSLEKTTGRPTMVWKDVGTSSHLLESG